MMEFGVEFVSIVHKQDNQLSMPWMHNLGLLFKQYNDKDNAQLF